MDAKKIVEIYNAKLINMGLEDYIVKDEDEDKKKKGE